MNPSITDKLKTNAQHYSAQFLVDALFVVTLALLCFGLTMVYSASAVSAFGRYKNDTYFLQRQALFVGLGLLGMRLVQTVPLNFIRQAMRFLWLLGIMSLLLVLVPGLGRVANGARRWFTFLPLQPAEFAKILVILLMAHALAKKETFKQTRYIWLSAFAAQSIIILVLLEPDFGTAAVLQFLVIMMLYLGGARLGKVFAIILALIPVGVYLVQKSPYRMRRLHAFLDPFSDRLGAGYQLAEALMSIGSGGFFGEGLGDSKQKLYFVPEAHTDFIFAIIGEELGFLGVSLLIILFLSFLFLGYQLAMKHEDPFARYVTLGICFWIVSQAGLNMAVSTGLVPTKGLTLPLISYGGSSLLSCCLGIGLMFSAAHPLLRNAGSRR